MEPEEWLKTGTLTERDIETMRRYNNYALAKLSYSLYLMGTGLNALERLEKANELVEFIKNYDGNGMLI